MAEVVINNKVKTHEEGKHTYIGSYKGKEFKISLQDENNDKEGMMRYPVEGKVCVAVYMEGEDNFTDEEKNFIFKELVEMIKDYDNQVGGFDDGSLQVNFTNMTYDHAEKSMKLFGETVIPRFK